MHNRPSVTAAARNWNATGWVDLGGWLHTETVTHPISKERLKLEMSNLVHREAIKSYQTNKKSLQKGRGYDHVTRLNFYFSLKYGGGGQFEKQNIVISLLWIDQFQENLAWWCAAILLSITLTFRRRDGGQYHLYMIFAVFLSMAVNTIGKLQFLSFIVI